MEPFSWLPGRHRPSLEDALEGVRLDIAKFAIKDPRAAIAEVAAELRVKGLDFATFDGDTLYLALETPRRTRIVPIQGLARELDTTRIADAVRRAASPAAVVEIRQVKYAAGKSYGPFDTHEAFIASLHQETAKLRAEKTQLPGQS